MLLLLTVTRYLSTSTSEYRTADLEHHFVAATTTASYGVIVESEVQLRTGLSFYVGYTIIGAWFSIAFITFARGYTYNH